MRLKYLGATPIVFAGEGIPEWQPGAVQDVPEALAEGLLRDRPGEFAAVKDEPEPAKAEAPPVRGRGRSDEPAAVAAEVES